MTPAEKGQLLAQAVAENFGAIQRYVSSEPFVSFLDELGRLSTEQRYEVVDVVTSTPDLLADLKIAPPDGMKLQRSEFSDKRPTLFCVTAKLPDGLGWRKVTVTFDNQLGQQFVPVDKDRLELH